MTNARTITINGTTYDLSANRTWVVDTSSVSTRVVQKFTATASQTTFTVTGGYTVGMVDVFLNGVKLDNATEFTASNGSTVVLTAAAAVNDVVEVYKYGGQFIANNTLRQTTAFTATAGQTTFTVNYSVGFVDVFYNGSKLAASEFTATNGTSIVLGTACVVNDIVEVVAYNYTVGAFTGVGGSGTTNYIPKWTASGTLNNSQIFDNGTGVGIGTTSFSGTKLAIQADWVSGQATIKSYPISSLASGAAAGYGIFENDGTTRQAYFAVNSSRAEVWTTANKPLSLGTNDIERLVISSTGNVGINQSSPSVKFDINTGAISNNAYDGMRIADDGSHFWFLIRKDVSGNKRFAIYNGQGATSMTLQEGGGKVGINMTNPVTALNIQIGGASSYTGAGPSDSIRVSTGTANSWMACDNNGAFAYFGATSSGVAKFAGYNYSSGSSINMELGQGAMFISSGGRITTPYQPAFHAYGVSQGSYASNSYWVFPNTSFNRGGHYNTSNGLFTAPVAGLYEFTFANLGGTGTTVYRYYLYINNIETHQGVPIQLRMDKATTNGAYGTNFSRTAIVNLAANDYVRVYYRSDSGEGSYPNSNDAINEYCVFMGKLIG